MKLRQLTLISHRELVQWVWDARQRTMDLVADLDDEQLIGPMLDIINPLLWEIGHVAWFQEKWVLRHILKQNPVCPDVDSLYDSIAIAHHTRWKLPLPSRSETLVYIQTVRDRVMEALERNELSDELVYFVKYAVFHEDMHTEAFTYTRQTLALPAPEFSASSSGNSTFACHECGSFPGDVEIPGGVFYLGANHSDPFVFDNEKWAHEVNIKPFATARAPVTQEVYLAFVEERGYERREFWSEEGWEWRVSQQAKHPFYWKRASGGTWLRRHFDKWVPLEPHHPVIHINWYEAQAYCKFSGRRLPTEAEWELAAASMPEDGGRMFSPSKRRYPWGNKTPSGHQVNMDWRAMGCTDVAALPPGDSGFGCRQMLGNVWEWTSSTFLPYPGFEVDPYKEYSEPWFGTRKVLRGGCWATRSRMLRNTWRNYFTPDRRDIFAGFRTCALNQ